MKIVKASNGKTRITLSKKEWEEIGKTAQWMNAGPDKVRQENEKSYWLEPDQMRRNMEEFYSKSDNKDPNASNFAVDIRKRVSLPPNLRRKAGNKFADLTRNNYFERYPLEEVEAILSSIDALIVQEDGTKWSGMIGPTGQCGDEKNRPFSFDIAFRHPKTGEYVLSTSQLVTTLCTMPSGKLELVTYLS